MGFGAGNSSGTFYSPSNSASASFGGRGGGGGLGGFNPSFGNTGNVDLTFGQGKVWAEKTMREMKVLDALISDGLRGLPVETTKTNLQAILDRARQKYPQVQLVLAGMHMPPNMGEPYTTAFRRIFSDLAKSNRAALVPFLLEGVGGKPALNQPDRIHPTAEGQRIVADNVWKQLKPVLERLNSARPP